MRNALVVGLGRSGRAAAALLARTGWRVVAIDAGPAPGALAELAPLGVEVRERFDAPVPGVELVVKSPGVPAEVAPVRAARSAGVPVWSEIELAARHLPNPLIGITGTNGKTTTTELTAHLLRAAGMPAIACGNQGMPLAALVDAERPETWCVVECSSFQLEDIDRFHPRAGVLLNITPDHLDRHGDMGAYRRAKLRLFENQGPGDLAILPPPLASTGAAPARRLYDGPEGPDAAAWSHRGLHVAGLGRVCGWDDIPLRGRHNRENAMAAAALAAHAGLDAERLAAGLATFAAVAHRLEPVGARAGVSFVNDSKATNPDAVLAALDAYPSGVRLVAGGRAKGTPFDALAGACRGGVVHAYLMGEAGPEMAPSFAAAGVPHTVLAGLGEATRAAAHAARRGEVVLLSPACTSFDEFGGYEERGEAFRSLARELGAT